MALQFNYAMASNANLADIPLAEPPAGVSADLAGNPGSQTGVMIGTASAFMFAMLVVVSLRFYTKWRIIQAWSWDDLTLAAGFLGTAGVFILTCFFGVVSKVGSHVWNVPLGIVVSTTWTSENDCYDTLVPLTMGFVKITFFIYLYNTFHYCRLIRLVTLAGMILTTLFYLAVVIANLSLWVPKPGQPIPVLAPAQNSFSMNVALFTMACGGVLLDVVIWTLPLHALSRLNLPKTEKCCFAFIFFVGLIAVIASCISVVYRARANMDWDSDYLYHAMPAILSTFIELSAGCITAGLPHLLIPRAQLGSRGRIGDPGRCSPTDSKTYPLARAAESGSIKTPHRARQQYLHRKASTPSDGVATISEPMTHPFSKLGDACSYSRRSSLTALPVLERGTGKPDQEITLDEIHPDSKQQQQQRQRQRCANSDDDTVQNASALAALDEQRQQLSAQSFENFRSRDVDPQERWEALKNWPPEPPGWSDGGSCEGMGLEKGRVTTRYAFGD